jgi:hypothetical protein
MPNTTLTSIDSADLDSVTGGAPVKGGHSGSGNSEILSSLTGLQSSIKDLASKPAQQSAFGGSNLALFAMLAMNRPAQTNVVYVRGRRCW